MLQHSSVTTRKHREPFVILATGSVGQDVVVAYTRYTHHIDMAESKKYLNTGQTHNPPPTTNTITPPSSLRK